jgi:hypothetical protein
VGIVQI